MGTKIVVGSPAELASALSSANQHVAIACRPGQYGVLKIHGGQWNKIQVDSYFLSGACPTLDHKVVITSADPKAPAEFERIEIRESDRWIIDKVHVLPGWSNESTKAVQLYGNDLIFRNSFVSYEPEDTSLWTPINWVNRVGHGCDVKGKNCQVNDNTFKTVATGVQLQEGSDGSIARRNIIKEIHRDGMRLLSNNVTAAGNALYKWRVGHKANHTDGIQFYQGTKNTGGTLSGLVVKDNFIYAPPEPSVANWKAPMGFTLSNTHIKDSSFTNNIIATDRLSGMLFQSASNVRVAYNTLIDINPGDGDKHTVLRFTGDDSCLIENNLTNLINDQAQDGSRPVVRDNWEIEERHYDKWFFNWKKGNFSIKENTPDAGASLAYVDCWADKVTVKKKVDWGNPR
jgi:hypothetical protein